MAMGIGKEASVLYLFDLGIATSYKKKNGKHMKKKDGIFIGTAKYASVNCHEEYGK